DSTSLSAAIRSSPVRGSNTRRSSSLHIARSELARRGMRVGGGKAIREGFQLGSTSARLVSEHARRSGQGFERAQIRDALGLGERLSQPVVVLGDETL